MKRLKLDTVADLDCRYEPTAWPFAHNAQAAINEHWADAVRQRPHLFNGRVLMVTQANVEQRDAGAVLRACWTDVEFKAMLAWRDFGHPTRGMRNGFGMAALQAADGAFILGVMGAHTANAGRIYFPSGTPDLHDLRGPLVDLAGSIRRELIEETGLEPGLLDTDPGYMLIHDDIRVCVMQRVRTTETADATIGRIRAWLATQTLPELAGLHVVRTVDDIRPEMPPFVVRYLHHALGVDQPG